VPNIPIAEKNLKEKNIILKQIKNDSKIPFGNEYFDIVINRHESYEIMELKRISKKGGLFITQQVGGLNGIDFNIAFGIKAMDDIE